MAIKTFTRAAPVAVAALIAALIAGAPATLTLVLYGAAALATLPLLLHAYRLTRNLGPEWPGADIALMRLHLAAHAAPAVYVLTPWLAATPAEPTLAWIAAFALFFYTGRRTWRLLHRRFHAKLYFVFIRGNTAMLLMTVALTFAARAFELAAAEVFVARVLALYIAVHFLLIGVAVQRIEHDLQAQTTDR